MPEPLLLIVQCKQCELWIQTDNGQHPNAADILRCGCCTEEHNHDHWEDEGRAVPCRPVNLTLISPVQLQLGIGQPQSSIFSDAMTVREPGPGLVAQGQSGKKAIIQGQIYTEG